jgi:hypothetical protein
MAVLKAPMLSLDARGSVGKAITFSKWKGRKYVRTLVKPANPRSGLQVGQRSGVRFQSQQWKNLSAVIQGHWKTLYPTKKITPLNSMVKLNQTRLRQGLGVKQDPTVAAGAVEAAPTAGAAAAQPKSLVVTWVDSVGVNDWCTKIYMSTSTGFTPGPATLIQIIAKGVQTFTVAALKTGTPYYFQLAGNETGGTEGTRTAQFTGTPL